ncbi:nucleotidyltransferase domain-containing protein [Actinotalea sp. K2]|uniref:nucleotidyltransferase domain-containing protein n=1 Tax=Actinotalea sp. K2 TaxID=2939438 RepID=UPI002016C953|nr:nucleotidyltransferase domain-containing protein [Actinotalea sp. K2]MCL3860653.1 nucleotidyltransferase domain-containing protein [Actinotalea sp. K2]
MLSLESSSVEDAVADSSPDNYVTHRRDDQNVQHHRHQHTQNSHEWTLAPVSIAHVVNARSCRVCADAEVPVFVQGIASGHAMIEGVSAPSESRHLEVERLLADLAGWATSRDDIEAIALVGSCARGQAHEVSDVDVVILTPAFSDLAADETWFTSLRPESDLVRCATWGPVLERRFRLTSGLLVELGLTSPSWAGLSLDPGTHRVLGDGHRIVHDPHGLLARAREQLDSATSGD